MKIFVGIPVYNSSVHVGVMNGIIELALEVKERGDDMGVNYPSSPFLSLNRNLIMQAGLDSDWILMQDSDIEVPHPKFLYKMIETAYKYDAAMVGLLVKIKGDEETYACGMKAEGGYERLTKPPKGVEEVDVMGAGVTLINCKWIKDNLKQPYYEFIDYEKPAVLPEDWRFCEKIKEKGGKIVVDPSIETIHYGQGAWRYEI